MSQTTKKSQINVMWDCGAAATRMTIGSSINHVAAENINTQSPLNYSLSTNTGVFNVNARI